MECRASESPPNRLQDAEPVILESPYVLAGPVEQEGRSGGAAFGESKLLVAAAATDCPA